jgi:hypothetical protein
LAQYWPPDRSGKADRGSTRQAFLSDLGVSD